MDRTFKRVENIDERVKEVKLPYNAWKVLFVIDGETTVQQIAEKLDEEASVIEDALRHLEVTQLVIESQPLPEEKIEEVAEETIREEAESEKTEEAPEEKVLEVAEETVQEEVLAEETGESEEVAEEEQVLEPEEIIEEEPLMELEEEPLPEMEEEPLPEMEEEPLPEVEEEPLAEINEESTTEPAIPEEEPEPEIIMEEEPPVAAVEQSSEPEAKVEEKEEDILPDAMLEESSEMDLDLTEDIEGAEQLDVDFSESLETEESIISEVEEKVEEQTEPVTQEPPAEIKEEEPAAPVTPTEQPAMGDRKKILVIDDSIVIRKMVEIALEDEEYKLSSAVSGKDGLDKLDQVQPDLVILDLMLPDINGIDILKTIKQSRQIPVIMLSGKDSPQMVEKAKSAGADAFLPKPFKDEELKEQIKKLFTA